MVARYQPPRAGLDRNSLQEFRSLYRVLSAEESAPDMLRADLPVDANNWGIPGMFERPGTVVTPIDAHRTLTGLARPPRGEGRAHWLINGSALYNLRLDHNSTLSDEDKLFRLPNGERLHLQPFAAALLTYRDDPGCWTVLAHSGYPDDRTAINWEGTQNFIGAANFTGLATFNGGATVAAGGLDVNGGGVDINAGGLTVNAGGLTVNAGGIDVNAGGIDVTGSSIFRNAVEFDAQVDFDADVDVNLTSTFTGTATFNGAIVANSTVALDGNFTMLGGHTFAVTSPATFNGTLNVVGVTDFDDRVDFNDDLVSFGNITHATGNAVFSGTVFNVDNGTPAVFEDDVDIQGNLTQGVQLHSTTGSGQTVSLADGARFLIYTGNGAATFNALSGTLYEGRELTIVNADTTGSNDISLELVRNFASSVAAMTWNTEDHVGNLRMRRARGVDFVYTTNHPFSQGAGWVLKHNGLALGSRSSYTTASDVNNYDADGVRFIRFDAAATITVHGFSGGIDGQKVTLYNAQSSGGSNDVDLPFNSGTASVGNRILNRAGGSSSTFSLQPRQAIDMIYDGDDGFWILLVD